jgi:tetraacyldisaccharide 4'-kinase
LLAPLAGIYGAVAAARLQSPGRQAGLPVICVGNLTVGGAGKTPTALAVAKLLLAHRERPFFLSRGYGGRLAGPVEVNPSSHRAADVGDEPLMLARLAPTIVSRDRVAGVQAARRGGATVIVMDDGFQNSSLAKDIALIVIDGSRGIGNGRVIPAGPLRAPMRTQIARADALLVIGQGTAAAPTLEVAARRGISIFHGRLEPDRNTINALSGRKVLAFAGIGDPEKFFKTLTDSGVEIAERQSFPDHHRYTPDEADALLLRANAARLILLTTEKDLARLSGEAKLAALASRARALPVHLVVDEADQFRNMVLNVARR